MNPYKHTLMLLTLASGLYLGLSWVAFQWRNPLSNEMSFYRDFVDVVTWQKVPGYQPR